MDAFDLAEQELGAGWTRNPGRTIVRELPTAGMPDAFDQAEAELSLQAAIGDGSAQSGNLAPALSRLAATGAPMADTSPAPQFPMQIFDRPADPMPVEQWNELAQAEIQRRQAAGVPLSGSEREAIIAAHRAQYAGVPIARPNQTLGELTAATAGEQSALENIGSGFTRTVARGFSAPIGLVAPQTYRELRENQAAIYGTADPDSLSGFAGEAAGNVYNILPGLVAPWTTAISIGAGAAGDERADIAELRAQGRDISAAQEWTSAIAHGLIEIAAERIGIGAAAEASKRLAGTYAKRLLGAVQAGDQSLIRATISEILTAMGVNATEELVTQIGQNAAKKLTYLPEQPLLEGTGRATALGAVTGGAVTATGAAAHLADQAARARAQQPQQQTAAAESPQQSPAQGPQPTRVWQPGELPAGSAPIEDAGETQVNGVPVRLFRLPDGQVVFVAADQTTSTSSDAGGETQAGASTPVRPELARARELLDQHAPRQPDGTRRFSMPFFEQIEREQSELRRTLEALGDASIDTDQPAIQQRRQIVEAIRRLDQRYEQDIAEMERRRAEPAPIQGVEGRRVPEGRAVLDVSAPWQPNSRAVGAARQRAESRGIVAAGVTLAMPRHVPVGQIVDPGKPDPANITHWVTKLRAAAQGQVGDVPPVIVRQLDSGGYQVLDGAEQLAAARLVDLDRIPIIIAHGAAAPPAQTRPTEQRKSTGVAPRALAGQDRPAQKRALMDAARPGELIHGTDARNLPFIAREGVRPSALSELIDAEIVPDGGFRSGEIPSTAAGYAVGRAKEIPVLLVLKPHTNRGMPDRALSERHVAAVSQGKSYVATEDIEAVIFPDGQRLPLDRAIAHYESLKQQHGANLPRPAERATQKAPAAAQVPVAPKAERGMESGIISPKSAQTSPTRGRGPARTIAEASMADLRRAVKHFDLDVDPRSRWRMVEALRQIEHTRRREGRLGDDWSLLDEVPAETPAPPQAKPTKPKAAEPPDFVDRFPRPITDDRAELEKLGFDMEDGEISDEQLAAIHEGIRIRFDDSINTNVDYLSEWRDVVRQTDALLADYRAAFGSDAAEAFRQHLLEGQMPDEVERAARAYLARPGEKVNFEQLPEDMQQLVMDLLARSSAFDKADSAEFTIIEIPTSRFPVEKPQGGRGDYSELVTSGEYPPVIVAGDNWLDGLHRVDAARKAGLSHIRAIDLAEAGIVESDLEEDRNMDLRLLPADSKQAKPATATIREARTGQPIRLRVFQGRGATPEHIYGEQNVREGRGHPLFGPGEYFALSREDAEIFGAVTETTAELVNPYVLDNDRGWLDLLKQAAASVLHSMSRDYYERPQHTAAATARLQKVLRDRGHDGLIVRLQGDRTKRLHAAAGMDQVVVFRPDSGQSVPPKGGTRHGQSQDSPQEVAGSEEADDQGQGRQTRVLDPAGTTAAPSAGGAAVTPEQNQRRGAAAMEKVIADHVSVPRAMHRDEVGDITFDWGEPGTARKRFHDGWGISHIIAARDAQGQDGHAAARHMVAVIARGQVGQPYGREDGQRVNITLDDAAAVLSLRRFGEKETWLLTGWKDKGPGESGERVHSSGPTPDRPSVIGPAGGAGHSSTIDAPGTGAPRAAPVGGVAQTSETFSDRPAPKDYTSVKKGKTSKTQPPRGFTKKALEERLLDHAEQMGEGFTADDEAALEQAGGSRRSFIFYQRLPAEVRDFLEGRPGARRLFRVSNDRAQAGGEDAMYELGDRYWTIAENLATGRLTHAIEVAKRSPDPQIQFLAALHENLPPAKERPDTTVTPTTALQPGHTFRMMGFKFEVVEEADGYHVLRDGEDFPVVPLESLDAVPIDKGTLRFEDPQPRQQASAPTSDVGIFGQTIFRPATGRQQGSLFTEPASVESPKSERVKASASAIDPENTAQMFEDEPDVEQPDDDIPFMPAGAAAATAPPSTPAPAPALPPTPPPKAKSILARFFAARPERMSRQAINDFIVRRLKLASAVGIGRKPVLGFYRPRPGRIQRTKLAHDIWTQAHEVGHYLHHLMFAWRVAKPFYAELKALGLATSLPSYSPAQVRREGVAEFVRFWLIDPTVAAARAPGYFAEFEQRMLQFPEVWRAMHELRGMYRMYLAQDDVAKLEAMIDFDGQAPVRSPNRQSALRELYTELFDDLAPLDWMRRDLRGPDPMQPGDTTPPAPALPGQFSDDAYVAARLNRGNAGMVYGWMKHGVRDREGRFRAKGLEPILRSAGATSRSGYRRFSAYLLARRARELYQQQAAGQRQLRQTVRSQVGALGFTLEQAEATIRRYETPAFIQAAEDLQRWNDAVLDFIASSGTYSPEQIDAIKLMNRNYVPMHRVLDESASRSEGDGSRSLVDKPRLFNRIMGSGRRIKPPIATLARNTLRMIENAEANRAAVLAFKTLASSTRGGLYADPVARPLQATTAQLAEIKKTLIAAGVDPALMEPGPDGSDPEIDLSEAFTIFRPTAHNPARQEVALRIGGKIKIWQVHDQALYEALTGGLRPTTVNLVAKLLMIPRRVFRAGITLSLDFQVGNISRDQITAAVQSRYKAHIAKGDFFRGLWEIATNGRMYQLWLQAKGAGATKVDLINLADRKFETYARDLGRGRFERFLRTTINPLRWIDVLDAMSQTLENATRMGEFMRGIKAEGVSEEGLARSGLASRDVTVDFSRGGRVSRQVNQYAAFFNAGLQGKDVLARNFKNRPLVTGTRALIGLTIPTLILHHLLKDNPHYQEREKERQLYWLFPLGDPRTTDRFMRLLKPWELGQVFGTHAETMYDALTKEDPELLKELLPDGDTAINALMDTLPTAIMPILEVLPELGYDYFLQRSIDRPFDQHLEPHLRFDRYTSETAKTLGRWMNMSPRKIDHLIYGYTGHLGRSTVAALDRFAVEPLKQIKGVPIPHKELTEWLPGVRRLFSGPLTASRAESIIKLYEQIDELRRVERSMRAMTAGDREAYIEKHRDVLARSAELKEAERALGDFRDALNAVYDDPQMDPQEKRRRLRLLNIRMINLARRYAQKPDMPEPTVSE